jgi:isopenicillin N synthase-like dioxygenase
MHDVSVPVIDISDASPAGAERTAREIDRTFREIGFMTIVGHGVSPDAMAAVDAMGQTFFALPVVEKATAHSTVAKGNRGYIAEGVEAADQAPDLKESFAMGPLDRHAGGPELERNIWPAEPTGFQAAFETYYREMERLSLRLLALFERALDLPPDRLAPMFSRHASILRMHHYPEQAVAPQPGQIRIGAHTDYGAFTILKVKTGPGARGFQVLTKQKHWIDVEPHDDAFLINIGDLLMNWTNDRWQSNVHRVVNPKDKSENVARYSVPYFVQPNHDALIECIPTCLTPGSSAKYQPITAGEYRAKKIAGLYKRREMASAADDS